MITFSSFYYVPSPPTLSSPAGPSTFESEGGAPDGLSDGNDGGDIWEAADSNALNVV